MVFISIFSGKSILNSSRCQCPNEDPPHSLDCRGPEEAGADPQAPQAARCAVVFPFSAAGALVETTLEQVAIEGVCLPAIVEELTAAKLSKHLLDLRNPR